MTLSLLWTADRDGTFRTSGMIWSTLASVLCAVALWYHVATIENHTSELHKIINYAPDAVIVCDSRGHVLYANDAVRTITGFTEEDLRDNGVEQLIPDMLRAAHKAAVSHAVVKSGRGIEGVNYRRVYPVMRKDGQMITCLVSVGSIRHSGGPQFFAFVAPVTGDGKRPIEQKTVLDDVSQK